MSVRIITQNCRLDKFPISGRYKTIAETIFSLNPDVIFLQEIFLKYWTNIFKNPSYKQYFHTNGVAVKGGLLTLIKKDLSARDIVFQKFNHQGNLRSMQIFDRIGGKGYLDVILNNGLHLINTHLVATYSGRFVEDKNQLGQLKQLLSYTRNIKKALIGGDFNTDQDGLYYKLCLDQFKDLTANIGFTSPNGKRKIDFIISKGIKNVSGNAQLVKYPSGEYPSDHKGIIMEI